MSTTLLFVELLIIGVEVVAWVALFALAAFDSYWLGVLTTASWEGALTILFLVICYTLGILFDRLADRIFQAPGNYLKEKLFPNPPELYVVMRYKASKEDKDLSRLFEYTRSRIRITRSSAINLPLITVSALVLVASRGANIPQSSRFGLFIAIPAAGVLLTTLAIYSWYKLTSSYLLVVKASYESRNVREGNSNESTTLPSPFQRPMPSHSHLGILFVAVGSFLLWLISRKPRGE